jgi:hypothetical protein
MPEAPREVDNSAVAASLAAIRAGDVVSLSRLVDAHPGLVEVPVGAGGSLLGAVAEPDVFGDSLGHQLGVDRACVDLLIERGSELDGPLGLAACLTVSTGWKASSTGTGGSSGPTPTRAAGRCTSRPRSERSHASGS